MTEQIKYNGLLTIQKYVIYDNRNNIYDIADTEIEIRQKWNDSKLARIMAKAIDNHIEFFMGLAKLTEDELKEFELGDKV